MIVRYGSSNRVDVLLVLDRESVAIRRRDAARDVHQRVLANASAICPEHTDEGIIGRERSEQLPRHVPLNLLDD
eukprot:76753-Prymnesium_polylepis.1